MSEGKVIVMQAISGGGKSTWIKKNFPEAGRVTDGCDTTVVSADHFFDKTGEYVFVGAQLPEVDIEVIEEPKK